MSGPSQKTGSPGDLVTLLKTYLDTSRGLSYGESIECELKFGTRGIKPITKLDFDSVVQRFISAGFNIRGAAQNYMLRIMPQYVDPKTGVTRISNVRVELNGLRKIQSYCKTNTLPENGVSFVKKGGLRSEEGGFVPPVNFDDYNFRVTLNKEENLADIPASTALIQGTKSSWRDSKKVFRYIIRTTLAHPDLPFLVDLSVVKESKRRGRQLIPEYTILESEIFENKEKYEIEIEVDKSQISQSSAYNNAEQLSKSLKKTAQIVMCGLQQTNFPISYPEQNEVLFDYMRLFDKQFEQGSRVFSKNFIGPQPMTLQIRNIAPINPDTNIPNIREKYTVTEKADGARKLMFINSKGRIYLIDTNMNVQFTGAKTDVMELRNTLIDGEHILRDKKGRFINLYAAFDIYFLGKDDLRGETLLPVTKDGELVTKRPRLQALVGVINQLSPKSVVGNKLTPMRFTNKKFYAENESQTIFDGCGMILQQEKDGLFEYETDGLIFTPALLPVGGSRLGEKPKDYKAGWENAFKWKPPKWNTIDFLVSTKKTKKGVDFIGNIFQDGTDASAVQQLTQYQSLELRVGFDEKKHGYMNPCGDLIMDKVVAPDDVDKEEGYRPVIFVPTDPYDQDAGLCNVLLQEDSNGDKKMFTLEGEPFEDGMIIEFRYTPEREPRWRWEPLRVRYDKTAEYRSGMKNFGNAYHVANTNWHSLHNPISESMISTGQNIPDELGDDDVYYNRVTGATSTRGLRDFHNLFVKRKLIMGVSKPGQTLIDYAVGKGGDMPKWIASRLSFVFGIDISRDNIENRLDGACARYLNYRRKFNQMPYALYANGNASVNIRNTDALYSETGKMITRAVFGEGNRDEKALGKGVYRQFGKGKEGFNVSSIQFAIHYMFRDQTTLQGFLRNVSECTRVGGYFIGTSYDGEQIFQMLRSKKQGESSTIIEDSSKLWEVTKQYDRDSFESNSSCLGYGIDVFQESINKTFREFLVNYPYLTQLMEDYGFVPITRDEAKTLHLPGSIGSFKELYGEMSYLIKRDPSKKEEFGTALNMSTGEKKISFLNKYFVFKKVRDVDANRVSITLMNTTKEEEDLEQNLSSEAAEVVEDVVEEAKSTQPPKRKATKLKKRLVIKE